MTKDVKTPEKLTIGIEKLCLDPLPDAVRGRIEDMWRVRAMLSQYAKLKQELDGTQNRLREAISLGQRACSTMHEEYSGAEDFRDTIERFTTIREQSLLPTPEEPEETVAVNNWVSATDADCLRLSCEVGLIFLQMAIDSSSREERKLIFPRYLLLDCLRRIRDVAVHCKPISPLT
jgi:hypothetical protein